MYIERVSKDEVLRVEAWGPHAVRVRSAPEAISDEQPGALTAPPPGATPEVHGDVLVNGRITAALKDGRLRFTHTASGRELLAEHQPYVWHQGPRVHTTDRLEQQFRAYDDERFYGLGQHQHGRLDQKGCVIDLVQRNTTTTIPFLFSSRGYGLLWNNSAMGRVELAHDTTRWVAACPGQIDYWIVAGDTPAEIMSSYADATGHAPLVPEWATGFWQSKLRYKTQEELLAVAREYKRRDLPLSVIVADYFHWARMGDWSFDEEFWPDPAAMVEELETLGVKLMVSVWPTVDPAAESYAAMPLVKDLGGDPLTHPWPAKGHGTNHLPMAYYDPTDPEGRRLLWEQLREHYLDLGIEVFWLDASEPDLPPHKAERARYAAGSGRQVGNLYGDYNAQAVSDGMRQAGLDRPLLLVRSAWAGSQRYGVVLWSGDIRPTFDALATQVRTGLNVALSGIPWWNSDIGGFGGGDPTSPEYRELLIRWFQFGTFCPVMRLHGVREPSGPFVAESSGADNEVWSYGETAYDILSDHLRLRERLRPYLAQLAQAAHESGAPVLRPLLFDFPRDERAWVVDDQFLLGADVLVAPITAEGARERDVYLPAGTSWVDTVGKAVHKGGQTITATAPLERIPVFVREGAEIAAQVWPDAASL
jgi:alpha-D-xyloside xylohydrolase